MITTCRLLVSAVPLLAVVAAAGLARGEGPDFGREVRPILANRCFKCHGPDDATRQGGLRLDRRDDALAEADSGNRAIVPGHTDDSEIVARIHSADADVVMPPPDTKAVLTPGEKGILEAWIAAGAPYAEHWAFGKPARPPVPKVADAAGAAAPELFLLAETLDFFGGMPCTLYTRTGLFFRVHHCPVDGAEVPPVRDDLAPGLSGKVLRGRGRADDPVRCEEPVLVPKGDPGHRLATLHEHAHRGERPPPVDPERRRR